jgi:hypothetical protein
VSTPKTTGISAARPAMARPLAHSPATKSKCGVPPRITAPRAMMASYLPVATSFLATSGSSQAPGTRTMVMLPSLTP